jgi:ABC-type enterochelin transport system ATPase subunit
MTDGRITARGPTEQVFSGVRLKEVYDMDIQQFMKELLKKWN